MKFFSKSLLSWNKPYLFVLRMRTMSDWTRKLIWMIIVSVGICAIMLADYFRGRGAGRGSLPLMQKPRHVLRAELRKDCT